MKKIQITRRDALAGAGAVALTAAATGASAATTRLRFHTFYGTEIDPILDKFRDTVKEKSGGDLRVTVFHGGELVASDQLLDAAKNGSIDIAHGHGGYWSGQVDVGNIEAGLPGGWTSLDEAKAFFDSEPVDALLNEAYDAQDLFREHQDEIGIEMVDFKHMVYVQERAQYEPADEIADKDDVTILNISGTELRRRLAEGLEIPEWFSFPEVVKELRRTRPPRSQQGFTVFFTGFSGSGKSTIANALMVKLMEMGGRPVTLLDGDLVRKNLSSELGFSKEHRDLNIRRIGYVASEITKNGGIAICAPIAPYTATRRAVREMIEAYETGAAGHMVATMEVARDEVLIGVAHTGEGHLHDDFGGAWFAEVDFFDLPLFVDTPEYGGLGLHDVAPCER